MKSLPYRVWIASNAAIVAFLFIVDLMGSGQRFPNAIFYLAGGMIVGVSVFVAVFWERIQ